MINLYFDSQFQLQLFFLLINNKGLTRKDICNRLLKPRTTIYDNLYKLIKHGYVKYFDKHTYKKGRPYRFFYVYGKIKKSFFTINISITVKDTCESKIITPYKR